MVKNGKRPRPSPGKKKESKKQKVQRKFKLIDQIQVPLSNKFNILSDDDEEMSDDASRTQKQKISPIVVTDIEANIQ